jgi:hypothetical protein
MILPSKKGDWQQDLQVGVGEPFEHYLYLKYYFPRLTDNNCVQKLI